MTLRRLLWCGLLAGCAAHGMSAAQSTRQVAFESLDRGVAIPAYWTAPVDKHARADAGGKFPAIVALHGCGGLPANRDLVSYPQGRYVKMLTDAGYGVLYTDSFGGRNTKEICSQPLSARSITEFTRRLDVYAALNWLAQQPDVDARRLAVLGWSHGAQTVLAAADRTQPLVSEAKVLPRALVAFYPGCRNFVRAPRYEVAAPLLILSGALDNWTPAAPCRALAERLQQTQTDHAVKFIEYPDSHHSFDSPFPVRERRNIGSTKSGTATVGGNPAAREQSGRELLEFLRVHLERLTQ
jgi:dienelactone hydrolase